MSGFTTAISQDPRLKQGHKFMNAKQYEDAIIIFSSYLEDCVEASERSVETAQAYYEYGNALLTKEEENPANGVLANVESGPKSGEEENVDEEEEEGEGGEEEGGGEEGEEGGQEEPEGDVQIAWETLDVSIISSLTRPSFLLPPLLASNLLIYPS